MLAYLPNVLFASLGCIGLALLVLALRGRPFFRKPPRRCARCWYDLASLPQTRTCPECGRTAASERRLHRRRRSRWLVVLAMVLFVGAYAALAVPRLWARGGIGAVPSTVLVVLPPWLSESHSPETLNAVCGEIERRELWSWQKELLFVACLRGNQERPVGSEMWGFYEGHLLGLVQRGEEPLSLSRKRRLWLAVTPQLLATRRAWPEDVPVRIGTFNKWNSALGWFSGKLDRELIATITPTGTRIVFHLPGWQVEHENSPPTTRCGSESFWSDGTLELGTHPPGTVFSAHFQLVENGRVIWETTAPMLTVVGRLVGHMTAVQADLGAEDPTFPESRVLYDVRVSRHAIKFTLEGSVVLGYIGDAAFAAVFQICHNERPVAHARFWTESHRGSFCFSSLFGYELPLDGDISSLLDASDDDNSWTIRIRSDPETALRDVVATQYWSGELILTRDEFAVQR